MKKLTILATILMMLVFSYSALSATILSEKFESWPPAGWSILENGTDGWPWTNNLAAVRSNLAGGDGECADADADAAGSGTSDMDTELRTPSMDLSACTYAVYLTYVTAYNNNYSESGDAYTDISTNGGTSWITMLHWKEDQSPYGPGTNVVLNLSASNYVGYADTIIRFRYVAPGWHYWWEVDDVTVYEDTPDVGLEPSEQSDWKRPGPPAVSYQLTVTNKMYTDDSFNLFYQGAPWSVSGPPSTPTIVNGGSTTITVQVSIPHDTDCCIVQTSTVGAVSTSDPSVTNTALVITWSALEAEGFNVAGLSPGWSTNIIDPGSGYTPASVINVADSGSPTAYPYEGTHFVKFNSFNCQSDAVVRLEGPSFSTLVYSNIYVNFAWYESTGYDTRPDRVTVQWSVNGGTWNDATTYQRYNANTNAWMPKSCALPVGADRQSTLYIGFLFESEYGYNCYLDDMKVCGAWIPEPAMVGALGLALLLVRRK